ASLFRRLECENPGAGNLQPLRQVGAQELCDSLQTDEVAVEYFISGDEVSAFVASRAGFKVARSIGSRRKTDLMLSSLRFHMRKFTYGSEYASDRLENLKHAIDGRLADLYAEVFAPVEPLINGKRVIVIPHGPLHYLPFHALSNRGEYLIDRFEISYSPSAAVLQLCRARSKMTRRIWRSRTEPRKPTTDLVAVGISDPKTPNIREEISALAAMFPDTTQIRDDEATRENLFRLASGARFLHIATHGHFQRDNPMFSFLELADCRLDFYSLFDLKLKAELVTLSGCQTGINAVLPGDELHGLMRGFLYAGAPSLVTSLWSVNDRSTSETMVRMYRNIQTGDSKRSALRKAQLSIREENSHPYYWAPFVLIGSPN
ncbi:MAG TPA: CHAT domain-containing protein, partial [Blastocatellia bacterium]|nr:CHAT domain-containing protein [Blastocatellia bacterium]